ncbi:MAG: DUF4363 family protein [Desulfosporosinus sp.]|nr:DUF4363 family protein [Desulfosporosinus sp.]
MRTIPIIVIIVVILLGGSWTTYQYLQTTTQVLGSQLETVEYSLSTHKWEAAQKELHTTQQRWAENKTWWTVLLDHQEIDNIDISLNRLEKYIETQNVSLSLGEVSVLKLQVNHIFDTEQLNLQNIL